MEIFTNSIPTWVSTTFLLFLALSVHMVAKTFNKGAANAYNDYNKGDKIYNVIIVFYSVYFIYVSTLSFTGILLIQTTPPIIFILAVIPFLLFLLGVVFNLNSYKIILQHTSLDSLVILHTFRFIGVIFFILLFNKSIPAHFAYLAGIGDIATAFLAIFVAKAIRRKKSYAKLLTYAWNVFGLADIISVVSTAILIFINSIKTGSAELNELAYFPFCLLPAFAPATIIFLHITIFKKLISGSEDVHQEKTIGFNSI